MQQSTGDIWLQWEKIEQLGEIYTPRTGHCITNIGKHVYLFSGIDESDRQNDLYKFSIDTQIWEKLKYHGDVPQPRSGSTIINYTNFFIVYGGYTRKNGEYFNDMYKYNIQNNTWSKLALKNSPPPRIDHIMVKFNDAIIIFGGSNSIKRLNDMYELIIGSNEYKKINCEKGPTARFGHSGVVFQDYLYILGGWDGTNTLNDLWQFNMIQKKWHLLDQHCLLTSRYRHTAQVHKNCMYIFGGVDISQERFGDLHEYNFISKQWKRIIIQGEGPSARSFQKGIIHEGHMYILGGFDGLRKNDMFRINLDLVQIQSETDTIKKLSTNNQQKTPSKKEELIHSCSQQESMNEFVNLMKNIKNMVNPNEEGDFIQETYFRLPTQRWFCLPCKGEIFTPRTGHSGIVIKSKVYIFGGIDQEGNRTNDLYCYNIQSNTWMKLQTIGVPPSARSGTKCVQYENENKQIEIIYFGGYINKDIQHCNDLNIFNTETLQWSTVQISNQVSQNDLPIKRTDHTLVRFHKSLYVFGGRGQNKQICSDLKRFNLQNKVWKDIQSEGAMVQARFGHIAVVNEYSMYVFGGWDGLNCLNDMYQYSFPTNIWYEVRRQAGQKPDPRYRHDSIIFNNSLLIFGGVDQNQKRFNDLFSFNFETREWTNILTTGCQPSKRFINQNNLFFVVGGYDGERKNDMYMMVMQQETEDDSISLSFSMNRQNSSRNKIMVSNEQEPQNDYKTKEQIVIQMFNEQVKELSKKLQKEEERNLCKICYSREIDAIILECCHFVLCFACSTNLKYCPICRSQISKIVKTINL